ncbi:MAG: T9SS type A sorting domain-containing protein [Bacteroidales bacterium]|nr:T9SS type A sorting domain-containing protein [Bacteroidales bacterium]
MKQNIFFKALVLALLVAGGGSAMAQETNYQPVLIDDTISWTMPVQMGLAGCSVEEMKAYPFSGHHELWYFATYSEVPQLLGQLHSSEDNSELYFRPADSEEEFLIMDLNLSVNDTSHTQNEYGQPVDLIVDSVFVKNGKKHIRFNNYIHGSFPDSYRMFIEGVGPNWGLMERFGDGGFLYFICKRNGDSLSYAVSDASFENCDFREPCQGDGIIEMEGLATSPIYPNPFVDFFTINSRHTGTKLLIYDCMGRVCMEVELHQGSQTINMQKNPAGLYIVCLIHNGVRNLYKIIKND